MTDAKQSEIEELQSRISFQEQELDHLNDVVSQQSTEIQHLKKSVKLLADQLKQMANNQSPDVIDQKPPHY